MYRAVLYISESALSDETATTAQIDEINKTSSKANKENDIHGVLAHSKNRFLHVLEGETPTLSSLLDNIKEDTRHQNYNVIIDIESNERIYSDWEMISSQSAKQSELLGHFLRRSIDQLPMIDHEAHEVLEDFVNEIFY